MTYSIDLRKRVVEFVTDGGSKAEAFRQYKVSLWCVNDWCKREYLTPQPQQGRKRKLDWEALSRQIEEYPDALIRERAQHLGVHNNAIWYGNRQMKLTRKKTLRYSERKHNQRITLKRDVFILLQMYLYMTW